jgi:hypothetical protein
MKNKQPWGNSSEEQAEAARRRFQRYTEKIESEAAFFKCKMLALALLTATATLIWSLTNTANGKQVCEIVTEIFK